jgi:hypothetical protein
MTPRHTAALALVGWMIIIAPSGVSYDPTKWQVVDPAHPNVLTLLPPEFRDLRHWKIRSDKHGPLLSSLQSDCEAIRQSLEKNPQAPLMECIATEDPPQGKNSEAIPMPEKTVKRRL